MTPKQEKKYNRAMLSLEDGLAGLDSLIVELEDELATLKDEDEEEESE